MDGKPVGIRWIVIHFFIFCTISNALGKGQHGDDSHSPSAIRGAAIKDSAHAGTYQFNVHAPVISDVVEYVRDIVNNLRSADSTHLFSSDRQMVRGLKRKRRATLSSEDEEDEERVIFNHVPSKFIVLVKLDLPVSRLNSTSFLQLRQAFSVALGLPLENVIINKVNFQSDMVEMFFVQPGHTARLLDITDLLPARAISSAQLLTDLQASLPWMNITQVSPEGEIIVAAFSVPFLEQSYFPYITAVSCVLIVLSIAIIVYCCCKKDGKKNADDEIPTKQIFYPTIKPAIREGVMIQPDVGHVYVAKGCITGIPAQPIRAKTKGLLERRGSNASLTIDLNPSPELQRWEGTPPKESSGLEFLLSAGNRLSRRDLANSLRNPVAIIEEFFEIPMNHPDKVYVAGSGMKNRYKTIIPNKHSRVILPDNEWDPLSSYINANYVKGYDGEPKAFIATQGPLSHTIVDFWRMIWNEKSPVIVMITKLKEKNKIKCENYLPEIHGTYGDVEVTIERCVERQSYKVRHLLLKHHGETHSVLHYWYTAWPDHKPPDSPTMLLDMVIDVELYRYKDNGVSSKGSVVVHCSAGIGRTGCFIAISTGIRQLREEQSVDILGIVCNMRIDRGGMIQNNEQYEFVHQALYQYDRLLKDRGRLQSME